MKLCVNKLYIVTTVVNASVKENTCLIIFTDVSWHYSCAVAKQK